MLSGIAYRGGQDNVTQTGLEAKKEKKKSGPNGTEEKSFD
jgi:hypothetical protein